MTDTDDTEYTEVKKPGKEITVVQDQGIFQHETGDIYDGFFEAKKKDKSLKMHGPGTYTTAEGDSYAGTWENDRLLPSEEVTITFADGSKYEGIFKDWSYNGPGKYTYPDGSIIACNFVDNCPVADLVLTDPNGHQWLSKAERGFAWFEPVNHYYEILEKTREGGRIRKHHRKMEQVLNEPETAEPLRVKSAKSKLNAK